MDAIWLWPTSGQQINKHKSSDSKCCDCSFESREMSAPDVLPLNFLNVFVHLCHSNLCLFTCSQLHFLTNPSVNPLNWFFQIALFNPKIIFTTFSRRMYAPVVKEGIFPLFFTVWSLIFRIMSTVCQAFNLYLISKWKDDKLKLTL